jgi:integrase
MASIRKRGDRWQAQIRRKDFPQQTRSFLCRQDAERWVRSLERQMDLGEVAMVPLGYPEMTLGDLVQRYLLDIVPAKRSAWYEAVILRAFQRHALCGKRLAAVTFEDFGRYRTERLRCITASSLRRQLNPLRNMFEVARKEWGLPLKYNPLSGLKIYDRAPPRERRLLPEERERLMAAAGMTKNALVLPMILLALETGLRRAELLAATWSALDLERRALTIPETKNGHSRTIPLTREAMEILATLPRDDTRLFPMTATAFRLAWERLVKRAGVEDLHFHDLRHEAISRFFEMGLSTPEVALISGHRDMRMLFRYTHPTRQRILERLDAAQG